MTDRAHTQRPASPPDRLAGRLRKFSATPSGYRWEDVPLKKYKHEGPHFRDITRQTLFSEDDDQPCELRYFEIKAGGHSTFEQHEHAHAIMVLHGRGRAIVGERIMNIEAYDLLSVPQWTWHQLQAAADAPLGFLCQVSCERDRPIRPTDDERQGLLDHPEIGSEIRL